MKNTTKLVSLIVCISFSVLISAKELSAIFKTDSIEEWLSNSILTSWLMPNENTLNNSLTLFEEDFENDSTNKNWTLINPSYNNWYIGKTVKNRGSKGLYITNDYGNSNAYSNPFLNTHEYAYAVSPSITLASNVTTSELSFDWRNKGEASTQGIGNDYLSVWIIPATYQVNKNTDIASLNSGGIEVITNLYNQSSFVRAINSVDLSAFAGTAIKLVFKWENNDSTVNNPPAALDNILLATTTCSSVASMVAQTINNNEATLQWTYFNSIPQQVEFYVSTNNQVPTNSTTSTHQSSGTSYKLDNLQGNTIYEVWYRTICDATNKGYWNGPLLLETTCDLVEIPYKEGFNLQSPSFKCWTITDENADNKGWGLTKSSYEGNQAINFTSTGSKIENDDWLVTPVFNFKKGTYKMSFYYKGTAYNHAEFKLLLSSKGLGKVNFSTVILPSFAFTTTTFEKKEVLFTILNDGEYNLAFVVDNQHTSSKSTTQFTLDDFRLEREDCTANIVSSLGVLTDTSASISWTDPLNQAWEYYIVEKTTDNSATFPTKGGTKTTVNTIIAAFDTNNGTALKGNTLYDFYVRAICSNGGVRSWSEPISFKTPCSNYALPFAEDFEDTTTQMDCWKIIDNNKDKDYDRNIWRRTQYQGINNSYAASFEGSYYSSNQHDDYLITPGIKMNGGIYKLTYSYKSGTSKTNSFKLLLAVNGDQINDFTTVLRPDNTSLTNGNFKEEIVYITGITGTARVAWHINGQKDCSLLLDNIKIEEVDCSSVSKLEAQAIQAYQVDLNWDDPINTAWEYWLQEEKGILPTSQGVATNTKTNTVVKDSNGQTLKASTSYEFYVRVHCSNGNYTAWQGPYIFKTACGIISLPFTETYNVASSTKDCWTIIDDNQDEDTYYGDNKWRFENSSSSAYEGNGYAYFENYNAKTNADWLLSPLFKTTLDTYRVTFYLKGSVSNTSELELYLLQNGSTTTGKKVLVPAKPYTNTKYEKHIAYFSNVSGNYNLGWYIKGNTNTKISIGKVIVEKVNCIDPIDLQVDKVQSNEVTIKWLDTVNTKWEYSIDLKGIVPTSITKGVSVQTPSAQVNKSVAGLALQSQTEYDVYVRAICGTTSYGDWVGPLSVKTTCSPFNLPFKEDFESTSIALECWKVIDNNKDATTYNDNTWAIDNYSGATGKSAMKFYSYSAVQHDDYLISPTLKLSNKTYRLRYQYKVQSSGSNTFSVLLSESGSTISSFTQEILPSASYKNGAYQVQDIYIQGTNKDVNIAWHVNGKGSTTIFIDDITIEEVSCSNVANLAFSKVTDTQVELNWEDSINTNWEYWLQEKGGQTPTSKGIVTAVSTNTVLKDINNQSLKAQTEYEFYVRVQCNGTSYTEWVGPVSFKTTCSSFALPFTESFEDIPLTYECWTILDNNKDGSSNSHVWFRNKSNAVTGSFSMRFYSNTYGSKQHDDYLISPTLKLSTKMYRLRYKYRVTSYGDNTFRVLLSDSGIELSSFTQELVASSSYNNTKYEVQDVYIQGNNKDVNIAWHVNGKDNAEIYLDDIIVEEVACSNVSNLSFSNVKYNQANIVWEDTFNANWEYWLQEKGGQTPTSKGIATAVRTNTVLKDINNQALKPQTEYEFYVRVFCKNSGYTEWIGPVSFKTTCAIATLPLTESFDLTSTSKECWTLLDNNQDQKSGDNIWRMTSSTSASHQDDGYIYFENYNTKSNDDWLISPVFNAADETYKVSFYVKGSSYNTSDLEVFLLSGSSTASKISLLPSKVYTNTAYQKYEAYFSGVSGEHSIGWYLSGATSTKLYLDTITIEKVNCAAPVSMEISNVLHNQVNLNWTDQSNQSWEYAIQEVGKGIPTVSGVSTSTINNTVKTALNGQNLKSNTAYEAYVRVLCSSGNNTEWVGPIAFETSCGTLTLPYLETFEANSSSKKCWTILDLNKDAEKNYGDNKWQYNDNSNNAYNGKGYAYFENYNTSSNDDWLISPTMESKGETYKVTYYIKGNSSNTSSLVVNLLQDANPSASVQTLVASKVYQNIKYEQVVVYFSNVVGTLNIGWHIQGATQTNLYLDQVTIEIVNCEDPTDLQKTRSKSNEISFEWTDNSNSSWEYWIQEKTNKSTKPVINGTITSVNKGIAMQTFDGKNLKPQTDYEVFVRSRCTNGSFTDWTLPIVIRTTCAVLSIPFVEDFEEHSSNLECWNIEDNNSDKTSNGANTWKVSSKNAHEGNQKMVFEANSNGQNHDDYLISPTFKGTQNTVKLSYFYKGSSSNTSEFEVLLSTNGTALTSFNQVLVMQEKYKNDTYEQRVVYITNVSSDFTIAWHVVGQGSSSIAIDLVRLEEVNCTSPTDIVFEQVLSNEVSISWTDKHNTDWEYWIQELGYPYPNANGVPTTINTISTKLDIFGNTLSPLTDYEVYVRAKCVDGTYTAWEEAAFFKTACTPLPLSFFENFDTSSSSKDCWTILDNGDENQGQNTWNTTSKDVYLGDGAMLFSNSYNNKGNNDWLISPSVVMTSNKYILTFYYKTGYYDTEIELLLSSGGAIPANFTTSIAPKKKYKSANYVKEEIIFQGIPGIVNIGWHLSGSSNNQIWIDNVSIAEQNCDPVDLATLKIDKIDSDSVSLSWHDTVNTEWEFFTTTIGGAMPTSQQNGMLAKTQQVKLTRLSVSNSALLQPQTGYEFYVRTRCGNGNKGNWIGPVKFKTGCSIQTLPFEETFNSKSSSFECWTTNDKNKDAIGTSNYWKKHSYTTYEGDGAMNINSKKTNDDWLISPQLDLNAAKVYRVTFYYKISGNAEANVEVLLSTKSQATADFVTNVSNGVTHYKNNQWLQAKYFITKTSKAYIAIRELSTNGSDLYLDQFKIEEVQGCAEVVDLNVKDVKRNEATLFWEDTLNANTYEYILQLKGGSIPSGKGKNVTGKTTTVKVDNTGKGLQALTEYEYYVRTVCSGGNSMWVGPFVFKTACGIYKAPFYESFDSTSTTKECWTINDVSQDADFSGYNSWKSTYSGAKGAAMVFEGSKNIATHDDWLISPTLETKVNTYYRLKYKYLVSGSSNNKQFEVKISHTGIAVGGFNQTVVAKKDYPAEKDWVEDTVFFYSAGGEVNIGWHVVAKDNFTLYLDEITIEEVKGCPEPQQLTLLSAEKTTLTFSWIDTMGATAWEYYIQPLNSGPPTGNGVKVNNKTIVGDRDSRSKTTVKPNGTYEIYVRTVCSNGEYSDWVGPIIAETACDVYATPFVESFNTNSLSWRCWTVLDVNKDGSNRSNQWLPTSINPYEVDKAIVFEGSSNKQHDDWLISPVFDLDGSDYLLKYQYRIGDKNSSDFEVMLSTNGIKTSEFKTNVVTRKTYHNKNYVEEVVLIKGIKGKVNIGWHVVSNGIGIIYLDNVSLNKVDNCIDPVQVIMTDKTETSITVEWKQFGSTTQWEVIAVPLKEAPDYKKKTSIVVNGIPKATLLNLFKGTAYTIYVRVLCKEMSNNTNWSTGINVYTANSEFATCENGANLIVNIGTTCKELNAISMIGTAPSLYPEPSCTGSNKQKDVWYSFVAESHTQIFNIQDFTSLSGNQSMQVNATIYEADCFTLAKAKSRCFNFTKGYTQSIQKNMIKGKTYLLRLATEEGVPDFYFNLCITSPQYITVEESGKPRSVEDLVKKVLVTQDCDVVDNVTFISGEKYNDANSIGYYDSGNAPFAFKDGIVLATSKVINAAGPSSDTDSRNTTKWVGDADLDVLLKQMKRPDLSANATVLEFDFISMLDTLKFDFIFASNEYGTFQCRYSDIFAFLLTDLTTGEVSNLAVIPGTNTPVSVTNIRNSKYNNGCQNENVEYFDAYFANNHLNNPIGYKGYTIPMTATSPVTPGRKYHIKLAIANYDDTQLNSAVFLKGGSFDLGKVDLGNNLLIKDGTALCPGTTKVLKSGIDLGTNNNFRIEINWFKNGQLLPNEKSESLTINESGLYKIEVAYLDFGCRSTGEVEVEVFPTIRSQVSNAAKIQLCTNFLGTQTIDLYEVEINMKGQKAEELDMLVFSYHETEADAIIDQKPITNSRVYKTDFNSEQKKLYIRVVDTRGGCFDVFDVMLEKQDSPQATVVNDAVVCGSYKFPVVGKQERFYTLPNAGGTEYKSGDWIDTPGNYQFYVVRREGESGCFEQSSFAVKIVPLVYVDRIENQTLECELFVLPELSAYNKYFTAPHGKGIELQAGTIIYQDQQLFIYASSLNGTCVEESSFVVKYNDCPIPKGISPNGDGLNDSFDLSQHGVLEISIFNRLGRKVYHHGLGYTKQWDGRDQKGNQLPSGTYYYVINTHGKTRTGWVQINR